MDKSPEAFRTISEVSRWLDTPTHVLRFWESRFPEISPVKRAGGRRYYRPEDMALLGGIKTMLHDQGLSIKAVQDLLASDGVAGVSALSPSLDTMGAAPHEPGEAAQTRFSLMADQEAPPADADPLAEPAPDSEPPPRANHTAADPMREMGLPQPAPPQPAPPEPATGPHRQARVWGRPAAQSAVPGFRHRDPEHETSPHARPRRLFADEPAAPSDTSDTPRPRRHAPRDPDAPIQGFFFSDLEDELSPAPAAELPDALKGDPDAAFGLDTWPQQDAPQTAGPVRSDPILPPHDEPAAQPLQPARRTPLPRDPADPDLTAPRPPSAAAALRALTAAEFCRAMTADALPPLAQRLRTLVARAA